MLHINDCHVFKRKFLHLLAGHSLSLCAGLVFTYLYYFSSPDSLLFYVFLIFALVFFFISLNNLIILITLYKLKKYLDILLIPPYHITRISTKYVNILQVHISKNGTSFAILEVRLLNPDYMRIIAPLKTPLSFFNPSNRRIVGDGDKVLHIELPKAIWDIHTEFEDNTNLLIVEVNGENLRGHKNILNIIEFIRDSLEKQNYSNEIVKKLPNAMVASNGYMKGYLCLDCGYLIPRKRLKDKCPATGNKHNTTPILLDIRAPRYQSERLSIVTVFLILGILTLFIYINKIFPWYSFGYFLVIGIVLSLTIALIYGWYCRNIAAFKNMLKHFEAKKRFIMEQIKEKEES